VLTRWLPVAIFGAALAPIVTQGCADEYECSDAGRQALYNKRIAPLLVEDRPSSCSQCHLAGVDLGMWVKETPCQTMACMANRGIVDLDDPEASLILTWIGRAQPESELITAQVIAEEREGVLEWIRSSSECGLCWSGQGDPCADDLSAADCGVDEMDPSSFGFQDPGDCTATRVTSTSRATMCRRHPSGSPSAIAASPRSRRCGA
jgi:hypothetical protein